MLIKGLGLGGAERQVVDIAIQLQRSSVPVTVAFFLAHKRALVAELEAAGIEVVQLSSRRRVTFRSLWAYLCLIRQRQFTVVHSHLPIPGLVARLGRLVAGYRLIHTEHNLLSRLNPLVATLNRLTYWCNHELVACSEPVWASMARKGRFIDNGVDIQAIDERLAASSVLRRRYDFDKNQVVWVCIANLWPKKNHRLLLHAFARLLESQPDVRLVLIGQDASERRPLERLCLQLSLGEKVIFNGPEQNAVTLLKGADGFVLASDFEGLPLSLLEAMVAGLPAVCTAVGGIPGVLVDHKTGILVEKSDLDGLTAALSKLSADPSLRTAYGSAGRKRVISRYSIDEMCRQLFGLYGLETENK